MDGQSNIAKCSGRFLLDGIVFSTVEENEREEVGKREGEGCGGGGGSLTVSLYLMLPSPKRSPK